MNKIFLCGMFRGNREILQETVEPVLKFFDGLIAVVDSRAKIEDIDWLCSIKKGGEIIRGKWVNDHAWTMNRFFLSDKLKWGDFVVIIDETDKLNESFVSGLREKLEEYRNNDIGTVWLDHPFIIRYHPGIRIFGSPHWFVGNILGKIIGLSSLPNYKKEDYVENLRSRDVLRSAFLSPIKYTFCYPPFSNHFDLLYSQFSHAIKQKHENLRISFQYYCIQELGLELTMESLEKYMVDNAGKYSDFFEQMIEFEVNIKDAFRLWVLKQPWQELGANRFDWSYFHWKRTGEIIQDKTKTGYQGVFNQYKIAKGEIPE